MKIELNDGKIIEIKNGSNVIECAYEISKSLEKKCFGAIVDDKYFYSNFDILNQNQKIKILTDDDKNEYNNAVDNSIRLIISKSLSDNFSSMKFVNNFIDFERENFEGKILFDSKTRFKIDEIKKIQLMIEKTLSKINKIKFVSDNVKKYKKELLKTYRDQKYVDELINVQTEIKSNVVLIGDSYFVSYYPYIESLTNFKISLQSFSGEYWQGNANNQMIQRLSFIAAKNNVFLQEKISKFENIKNSDHRFIGKNMEIFTIDPLIGQGLPIWLPNGTTLKNTIKKFVMEKEWEYDFIQVETPVIGTSELYKISGHWDHYKDDMFTPMNFAKEELILRPMTCPHHIVLYKNKPKTYKELPLRITEHSPLFRYESSGSLTGLERVRSMELTDSHIFVCSNQVSDEFMHCYKLIEDVLQTFNIKIDYISLSLRDKNNYDKYYQDDDMWNNAEKELEDMLIKNKIKYKKMIGEAAFYGPKLDIQIRTMLGHEITVSTLQLDFLFAKKFDINFINNKNENERPIIIHRGLIGTYERFIAILLEQTKGNLPLWLSPVQIEIIPVILDDKIINYCKKLVKNFKINYIRSHVDLRDERLSYKIRDCQIKKTPIQLIIGEKEILSNNITFRRYQSEDSTTLSIDEFIKKINIEIANKK